MGEVAASAQGVRVYRAPRTRFQWQENSKLVTGRTYSALHALDFYAAAR